MGDKTSTHKLGGEIYRHSRTLYYRADCISKAQNELSDYSLKDKQSDWNLDNQKFQYALQVSALIHNFS